jgi:PAS domain S-box-containing protein
VQKGKGDSQNTEAQWSQFEKLLQEISSRFISLPVNLIDSVIEETQRRICETLDFDLSTLWQASDKDHHVMVLTHLHTPPDGPQPVEKLDASVTFPWVYEKMLSGETLAYSNDQLSEKATLDKKSRIFYGVKSSVNLPLMAGGGPLLGILSFDTLREYRQWKVEKVNRLKLVAEVFTNALVRKRAEEHLVKSENRLKLAASSAGIGFWELNLNTRIFWATDKALSIFGWEDRNNISLERFERPVHPADLDYVRQAITHSIDQKTQLSIEYRIYKDGDASLKWVHSSGYPYFKPSGEPDMLLGVSLDITSRKNLETQRIKEKERLASAIDITALGFYEMVENNCIDFLDDRMRDLIGISARDDQRARDFWLEHIHPEDRAYVQGIIRNVLEEGVDRFELNYRYMHPLRGLTWLRHLSRVLDRNADGHAARIIGVMQDITEQKFAEKRLQKSEAMLRNNQKDLQRLAGRLIAVKEEELRRLSRELHDDLTQRLAVLAINSGKLELEMGSTTHASSEHLETVIEIKEQLIQMSEDVHRLSRQLHPTILDDLGLVRAIESECDATTIRDQIVVNFTKENVPEFIPNAISLCIYRVIQEGLKNVIRHSGVKKCDIVLRSVQDRILLTIKDDGAGFNPKEVRQKPGLGLSSMRERVQFVQGSFSVETDLEQGTTIHAQIPIIMEKDDAS